MMFGVGSGGVRVDEVCTYIHGTVHAHSQEDHHPKRTQSLKTPKAVVSSLRVTESVAFGQRPEKKTWAAAGHGKFQGH